MRYRCGFEHTHTCYCTTPSDAPVESADSVMPWHLVITSMQVFLVMNSHYPNTHYLTQEPIDLDKSSEESLALTILLLDVQSLGTKQIWIIWNLSLAVQTQNYFAMKLHPFEILHIQIWTENFKQTEKTLTCSSPSHHPPGFFFRIKISWPGAKVSCSGPVAVYEAITWAISEKQDPTSWGTVIVKRRKS